LTLYEACEREPDAVIIQCEVEGFEKALRQMAEQVKQLKKLREKLDAAEAKSNISSWFYESQIDERERRINRLKSTRWLWAGGGLAAGVVATLLTILLAN